MDSSGYLLSVRMTAIVAVALVIGLISGLLTFAQTKSWPQALMVGGGASLASVLGLHAIVAR